MYFENGVLHSTHLTKFRPQNFGKGKINAKKNRDEDYTN